MMEHLLTTYIRTKTVCDKAGVANDGTIILNQVELTRLGKELDMSVNEVNIKLIELKRKGEIKGYGNNFKVAEEAGLIKPSLLEITGKKHQRRATTRDKVALYTEKIQKGPGSRKFKEFLASKPMDKYFTKGP